MYSKVISEDNNHHDNDRVDDDHSGSRPKILQNLLMLSRVRLGQNFFEVDQSSDYCGKIGLNQK